MPTLHQGRKIRVHEERIEMAFIFKWSEAFLTHLASVDEQHCRLVGLINELAEQVSSTEEIDPETFQEARDTLSNYAEFHFADEESRMETSRLDPRHLAYHREQHQAFDEEISRLGQANGLSVEQTRSFIEFLFHWLAHHILVVDQSMARQLRAIAEGSSPAQAFEEDARIKVGGTDPLLAALGALYQRVLERNQELKKLNRELEQRVRMRTLELENANRQLQLISTHDELTGLPNRRYANLFLERLWHEFERFGRTLSVLMLDADRFKQVNDNFGHEVGDALLRSLARRLRDSVRECDIVCRLGGDEFLVICPQTPQLQASEVAKRILAATEPFYNEDGVECWDGAISIGIAEVGDTMMRFEDFLRTADKALYAAKRQGGARLACHGEATMKDARTPPDGAEHNA